MATLRRACIAGASCRVFLPANGALYEARLAHADSGALLLHVQPHEELAALRPASVVSVIFSHTGGTCCFMSRVLSQTLSDGALDRDRARLQGVAAVIEGGARIRLAVPESISGIDGRRAFRIPVVDGRLTLELVGDAGPVEDASAIDICAAGIQLELPASASELEVLDSVGLTLRLQGAVFTTQAEVRRRQDQRYGLCFPDLLREGKVHPPASLATILQGLERAWLKRRHRG